MNVFRSFRLRIALLAVMLSSAVLAVFGISAWQLARRLGTDNLDEHIREECRREANESRRPGHWERLEHQLHNDVEGIRDRSPFAVVARERGRDNLVFQMSNWPGEISPQAFGDPPAPPPQTEDGRRPPPESRFRPPDELGPPDENVRGGPPGSPPPVSFGKFETVGTKSGGWRVGVGGSQQTTFIVAIGLRQLENSLAQLERVLLAAAIPGLLLIAAAGWFVATRAMRPVAALTRTAESITARDLRQRIPATTQAAEFQRLTDVFNAMLDRLEKSFGQATRFSADAAHELKTPLTILQGHLDQALRDSPDGSEQQKLCANLLEEVQRLKNIIRKLLLLSLADAGELKLNREEVDMGALVENAAEDAQILSPELKIETSIAPAVKIAADPDLLAQAVQNLVSNALKYNRAGGFVRLALARDAKAARFTVTNSGEPIPAADQPRIFERFYRADPSRTRAVEGVGLGLSLAREIARAHGGELALERSDGEATSFVLSLPA